MANWDDTIDLHDLLNNYIQIEKKQEESPVTLELPEPPEKPPVVFEERQKFFDPGLQYQRNSQAYRLLRADENEKMAILGCGELSFEKYALKDLSDRGIRHVVSVDIDVEPLSKGLVSMANHLNNGSDYAVKRNRYPVHIEVYKGDILAPSPVLSNVDVAISLEVIEHMPLEKSTEFLKCVLEKIRPKMFILSTPNFEYNVVFNKPMSFRHDDHHFEFTREEFKEWLSKHVPSSYKYEIIYVGELAGYEHLEGATQFAKIWREDTQISGNVIMGNEGTYQKVGDFVYRTSYYRLVEAVVMGAFKKYMDDFPFDPEQLTTVSSLKFWRISLESVLEFRTKPSIEIEEEDAMLMLTQFFATICYKSVMPETNKPAISIASKHNKNEIIANIKRHFVFSDDDSLPILRS